MLAIRGKDLDPDAAVDLRLVTTSGLAFPSPPSIAVDGEGRLVTAIGTAIHAGPAFVHGATVSLPVVLGLFRVQSYLPLDHEVRVLPRAASMRPDRLLGGTDLRQAVVASSRRVRGPGSDVRELRDHAPGDPFKHIAWKASARRGRLVVKAFDDEATVSVYVLLDVGPAMRAGTAGETRLDHALEAVLGLAASLGRSHDRFGLVSYDRRVLGFTRAESGPRMLEPIVAHLTETYAVVHAGFTEDSVDDVAIRASRFLESQHGLSLRLPGALRLGTAGGDIDIGRLHDTAVRALSDAPRARGSLGDAAADPVERDLRAFCRLRGIELPYRAQMPGEDRAPGLLSAIDRCLRDGSSGHIFVVVTDLADLSAESVAPAVRLAAAHRHQLIFWSPEPRSSAPVGDPAAHDLEQRLASLLADGRALRRKRVATELSTLGVRAIVDRAPSVPSDRAN